LQDPFGHKWSIGQTKSSPTQEQIEEAAKTVFAS
jgi:hypothetical protein